MYGMTSGTCLEISIQIVMVTVFIYKLNVMITFFIHKLKVMVIVFIHTLKNIRSM
jgi:hypothetical protein